MPGVPTIHVLPDEGMSFSKQVTIFCDRCGQWEQFNRTTVAEMRRELRQRGWRAVALNREKRDLVNSFNNSYFIEVQSRLRRLVVGPDVSGTFDTRSGTSARSAPAVRERESHDQRRTEVLVRKPGAGAGRDGPARQGG